MKKLYISALLSAVLLASLVPAARAQASLAQTTLASAATVSDSVINVASATGITAPPTNQQASTLLYIDEELMRVTAVSGTAITVVRGEQTHRTAHASGVRVYLGSPTYFGKQDKAGACSSTSELVLPAINVLSGNIYDCQDGQWVSLGRGTTLQGGGGSGGSTSTPVTCSVSSASSVTCTHNLGTSTPWVACYDSGGNLLGSTGASTSVMAVVATSANVATITFSGATTGSCLISTGGMGPKGDAGAAGSPGANGVDGAGAVGPAVIVTRSASYTTTATTVTAMPFDHTEYDSSSGAMHNDETENTKLNALTTGMYMAGCGMHGDSDPGLNTVQFRVNGDTMYLGNQIPKSGSGNGFFQTSATRPIFLTEGDYVECLYYTENAVALTASTGSTYAFLMKLF